MKAYRYGRQKEYWVKKFLENRGFIVVRSAGSHTLFDIVAVHPEKGIVRLIQVKAVKDFRWFGEEKDIFELAKNNKHENIRYELWVYYRNERQWWVYSACRKLIEELDINKLVVFYIIERNRIATNSAYEYIIPPFD